jgi:hypothetical protein
MSDYKIGKQYSMEDFREEMRRRGIAGPKPVSRETSVKISVNTFKTGKVISPIKLIAKKAHEKESTKELLIRTISCANARIREMSRHEPSTQKPCPWAVLTSVEPCSAECRCEGKGFVTYRFLISHYLKIINEFDIK